MNAEDTCFFVIGGRRDRNHARRFVFSRQNRWSAASARSLIIAFRFTPRQPFDDLTIDGNDVAELMTLR